MKDVYSSCRLKIVEYNKAVGTSRKMIQEHLKKSVTEEWK